MSQFATLTTRVNLDGRLFCDGEQLVVLKANQIKKIQVPVGEHLLQFVLEEDPSLCLERIMDFPAPGRNYLLLLDDIKKMVDQEREAKAKADAEAREAAQRRLEEEARLKAEAEARELARVKAEAEARARAEAEAREKAKMIAEEESRVKAEMEAKERAEAEARAKAELESHPQKIRIQGSSGIGARYEGFVKDGLPSGKGIAYYDNGDVYSGDWREGCAHGHGTYNWCDGRKYEGDWEYGQQSGQGIFTFASKTKITYEGEFKNGAFNGQGVLIYGDSYRVTANWKNGQINGPFRRFFPNGTFEDSDGGWLTIRNQVINDGKVVDSRGSLYYYKNGECLASSGVDDGRRIWYIRDHINCLVYYEEDYAGERIPKVFRNEAFLDRDIYSRLSDDSTEKKHCLYSYFHEISLLPDGKVIAPGYFFDTRSPSTTIFLLFRKTQVIYLSGFRKEVINALKTQVDRDLWEKGLWKDRNRISDSFDGESYMDERVGINYYIIRVKVMDLPDYLLDYLGG